VGTELLLDEREEFGTDEDLARGVPASAVEEGELLIREAYIELGMALCYSDLRCCEIS
jgi:hypothetical protein